MLLAIVLGIASGVVGFVPLLCGLRLTRRATATSSFGPMAILLLALIVSFVLAFALAILFVAWDKPNGFPFVLAEVVSLCAAAIAFGVADRRRH